MYVMDVHAKFALEWQPLIKVNTLTLAHDATKTWPLPTVTFFSHVLLISKFHGSRVYG